MNKDKTEEITTMWECDLKEKIVILAREPRAIEGPIFRSSRMYYWKVDGEICSMPVLPDAALDVEYKNIMDYWHTRR